MLKYVNKTVFGPDPSYIITYNNKPTMVTLVGDSIFCCNTTLPFHGCKAALIEVNKSKMISIDYDEPNYTPAIQKKVA